MSEPTAGPLKRTPLHALHQELGARMVPFAGYEMPVQYPTGILAEHPRPAAAGLFDVSHMGQVAADGQAAARARPGARDAGAGRHRGPEARPAALHAFTNESGGILDDLMVTSTGDHLLLVVNAASKDDDFAHIQKHLSATLRDRADVPRGLLALQGPEARRRWRGWRRRSPTMTFMTGAFVTIDGAQLLRLALGLHRRGRLRDLDAGRQGRADRGMLLAEPEVKPIGLGARDSLRLEAGLPLRPRPRHHDVADRGGPAVEHRQGAPRAGRLPRRRPHPEADRRGRAAHPRRPAARGQGDRPRGRRDRRSAARIVGKVTSGGFSPTLGRAIAMGFVDRGPVAPTAPRSRSSCAASPCRPRSCPCPSSPIAYYRG